MVKNIIITGKTTTGGAATTITLTNTRPIRSILEGELIKNIDSFAGGGVAAGANNTIVKNVAGTGIDVSGTGTAFTSPSATRTALSVVTATPTANLQIQRTGNATVSLFLTTALAATDIIFLSIEEVGEVVRP